jgi:hypothetical protein
MALLSQGRDVVNVDTEIDHDESSLFNMLARRSLA